MKLFLSWSGETSHQVARVLRDWLPSVIQAVRPYVSSEDIDKGARWSTDIAAELEQSSYGIICITRENVDAPWINFEAGALSKSIDKASVTPFLFRMKRSEVQGPLLQFQSVIYEKEDLLKLVQSINRRLEEVERLADEHLMRTFQVWWPQFQQELDKVPERPAAKRIRSSETKESGEILEEILELVRSQQRRLNSPEALLPPSYVASLLRREGRKMNRPQELLSSRFHGDIVELQGIARSLPEEVGCRDELLSRIDKIHWAFHDLEAESDLSHAPKRAAHEKEDFDMPAIYRYPKPKKPEEK